MLYQLEEGKLEIATDRNAQRLEDCILVLKAGRGEIGSLSAMVAAKAIIDETLREHEKWKNEPSIAERNKKIDQILKSDK
jgi:hypothetical protein